MFHPFIAFLSPGGGELLLVLLALLLLFGPKDAPRLLRNLQNKLHKLKHTVADFQRTLMSSDLVEKNSTPPEDTRVYDEEAADPPADEPPSPPSAGNTAP